MKKIILLTLCAVICAAFSGLTVSGNGDNVAEIIGYVTNVNGDVVHVLGEDFSEGWISRAAIKIGGAPVYDLITGFRVPAEYIEKDMDIRAVYRVSHNAEPSSAVVVWMNWDEDDAAVFTVVVSENINNGTEGIVFLSADGKYRVALTPETIILDPYNGFLSPEDVTPGTEFFIWVDMITASNPASVYPDKVVVVH
jgi:hypothetical protein